MKKGIIFLFFAIIFLFYVKNNVFASGTCKCKTSDTSLPVVGNIKQCTPDWSTFTCSGLNYKCVTQSDGACVEEGTCECQEGSTSGGGGGLDTTQGENTPVSIPGYPTETTKGLLSEKDLTLGMIIGKALTYVYVVAGMALLLVLIIGGISLMTAAGDPKKIEAGYGKIKDALIGFLIIFVSYMATQLVEVVLGVKIL